MTTYRYFTKDELRCHCDACKDDEEIYMDDFFMEQIVAIREQLGFSFPVTSAYRCTEHPVEARKSSPGAHTTGKAMDIQVSGKRALWLLEAALKQGFIGLGISQKGPHDKRFIHLDMWTEGPRPALWSY